VADEPKLTKDERWAGIAFIAWLEQQGYEYIRILAGRTRWAGLSKVGFMWALSSGPFGLRAPFQDMWCYPTQAAAQAALDAWDGGGEPEGWTRHPASRRYRPGGDPANERTD